VNSTRRTSTEPRLALNEIQGNVLPGFRKDRQRFQFFKLVDSASARPWLQGLHGRISSASEVFRAHVAWKKAKRRLGREPVEIDFYFMNAALSAHALRQLTSNEEVESFTDDAFKVGLAPRSAFIRDTAKLGEPGHVSTWVVGGLTKPVDLLLISASDNNSLVEGHAQELRGEAEANGFTHVWTDVGDVHRAPAPGHEHFGFRDGISDPALRGRRPKPPHEFVYPRTLPPGREFAGLRREFASPSKRLVWPGNFLFGYPRQDQDDPTKGNPADTPRGPGWSTNGSFLVFRRLRQDVKKLKTFADEAAASLRAKLSDDTIDAEKLLALLVGRWPSGTPVIRSPHRDTMLSEDARNYFGYDGPLGPALPGDPQPPGIPDPNGVIVPLAAHIRKVNPRNEPTDLGSAFRTPSRLILRRGITYAESEDDHGLLFVAYQSSIMNQFEFLMTNWIHNPNRPRSDGGHDPILVQSPGGEVVLRHQGREEVLRVPGGWVIPTGGEYFFAPPIAFFRERMARTE